MTPFSFWETTLAVVYVAATAAIAGGAGGFVSSFIQVKAVEIGSIWLHRAAETVGLIIAVLGTIASVYVANLVGYSPAVYMVIVSFAVAGFIITIGMATVYDYRYARELKNAYRGEEEHWTDAFARQESVETRGEQS